MPDSRLIQGLEQRRPLNWGGGLDLVLWLPWDCYIKRSKENLDDCIGSVGTVTVSFK